MVSRKVMLGGNVAWRGACPSWHFVSTLRNGSTFTEIFSHQIKISHVLDYCLVLSIDMCIIEQILLRKCNPLIDVSLCLLALVPVFVFWQLVCNKWNVSAMKSWTSLKVATYTEISLNNRFFNGAMSVMGGMVLRSTKTLVHTRLIDSHN